MGSLLLVAAVINWLVGLMMSPHGQTVAKGTEHVRTPVVSIIQGAAIVTIVLTAHTTKHQNPPQKPKKPTRDYALIALFVILVGSSIWTLVWLRTSVLG